MLSLSQKNQPAQSVPVWAAFFSEPEYYLFVQVLDAYLASQGIAYSIHAGAVLRIKDQSFSTEKMGLLNLAQTCKHFPPDAWSSVVSRHFEGLRVAAEFEKQFHQKAHDFSFVQEFIGVRLYHNEYVAAISDSLYIGKQITENIFAMLVFDFPHSVINIRPEQTIQWNQTNEKLFENGLENIRNKYPTRLSVEKIAELKIYLAIEDHFYTPNIILELPDRMSFSPENGLLVAVPNRHAAMIYPIENLQILKAIHHLIPVVNGMCKDGPGSISDKLYWYHDNKFTTLPYTVDRENIHFNPPEQFVTLLHTLEEW